MTGQIAYSFFNLLGIAAAWIVSRRMSFERYSSLSSQNKTKIFLGLTIGAVIGAKLPVLISYGWSLNYIITGKSIYGALIGAFIGINTIKYFFHIKGSYGDRFIVPLCVAVAFGKAGCFFNGCCGGTPTDSPFSIINHAGTAVHPTQIYSLLFHLVLALFFYILYRKKTAPGAHFILYILFYSIFRFFNEFIRTEPKLLAGFSAYQIMAFIIVPFFTLLLYKRINSINREAVKNA